MKESSQQFALFVVVALGAAAFSLGYSVLDPREHPATKGGEMAWVAQNLALHGQFANPFLARETGATAVVAPAYPAFLAMLLLAFGPLYGRMAIVLVSALAHGLHAALLIQLSRTAFKDQRPGIWAAVLAGAFPTIRFMPTWEAIFAAIGLLVFYIVSSRLITKGRTSAGRGSFLGMMAGALVLLNPVAAVVAIVWAMLLFRKHWKDFRHPIAAGACFSLLLFAVPMPWAIRNQVVLGAPVIKDSFGLTLHASNNECAVSNFVLNTRSGCEDRRNPLVNRAEANLLYNMGEVKYDAYRLNASVGWIKANPATFLRLATQRLMEFWFPNLVEGPYARMIWLITILSGTGFVLMARRRIGFLRFAICASLIYPLPYYVVVSDSRYRIPILWISLLGAGYLLQAAWERFESGRSARQDGSPAVSFVSRPTP